MPGEDEEEDYDDDDFDEEEDFDEDFEDEDSVRSIDDDDAEIEVFDGPEDDQESDGEIEIFDRQEDEGVGMDAPLEDAESLQPLISVGPHQQEDEDDVTASCAVGAEDGNAAVEADEAAAGMPALLAADADNRLTPGLETKSSPPKQEDVEEERTVSLAGVPVCVEVSSGSPEAEKENEATGVLADGFVAETAEHSPMIVEPSYTAMDSESPRTGREDDAVVTPTELLADDGREPTIALVEPSDDKLHSKCPVFKEDEKIADMPRVDSVHHAIAPSVRSESPTFKEGGDTMVKHPAHFSSGTPEPAQILEPSSSGFGSGLLKIEKVDENAAPPADSAGLADGTSEPSPRIAAEFALDPHLPALQEDEEDECAGEASALVDSSPMTDDIVESRAANWMDHKQVDASEAAVWSQLVAQRPPSMRPSACPFTLCFQAREAVETIKQDAAQTAVMEVIGADVAAANDSEAGNIKAADAGEIAVVVNVEPIEAPRSAATAVDDINKSNAPAMSNACPPPPAPSLEDNQRLTQTQPMELKRTVTLACLPAASQMQQFEHCFPLPMDLPARPRSVPNLGRPKRVKWQDIVGSIGINMDKDTSETIGSLKESFEKTRAAMARHFSTAIIDTQAMNQTFQKQCGLQALSRRGHSCRLRTSTFASRGPAVQIIAELESSEEEEVPEPEDPEVEVKEMKCSTGSLGTRYRSSMLSPSRQKLDAMRWEFEDRETSDQAHARLRSSHKVRRLNAVQEADHFLDMMKEKGGGNITIAWRRHFDSDGDGELSFKEFCNALAQLDYEVDTVRLWHQFGGGSGPGERKQLTLEVLDPKGAAVLDYFSEWCTEAYGGPLEVFRTLDDDGSDSLEPAELAEGLRELGFFDAPNIPSNLNSEEKILKNLYPLLDRAGCGTIQGEEMLFLEPDRQKRDRLAKELDRDRAFGGVSRGAPAQSDAGEFLHTEAMSSTQLGGKHWKMIPCNNRLSDSNSSKQGSFRATARALEAQKSPSQQSLADRSPKALPVLERPRSTSTPNLGSTSHRLTDSHVRFASDSPESGERSRLQQEEDKRLTYHMGCTSHAAPTAEEIAEHERQRRKGPVKKLLAASSSLPQLPPVNPVESAAKARRLLAKQNNSAIRMRASQQLRSARNIYGGTLVQPLPAVDPKVPTVAAKASLIFPATRHLKQARPDETKFHPRHSTSMDFFRSCKSQGLFDHYYHQLGDVL